jgi:hypothetical protein
MVEIAFAQNGHGPPPGGPWCDVLSPKPGQEVTGFITSHGTIAVWTHFLPELPGHQPRTTCCVEPRHQCEPCRRNMRRIWKGYLGCWQLHTAKPFIAEITAEAARHEPRLVNGTPLRGLMLKLSRPGRNCRGRVWAALEVPYRLPELPPPMNLIPLLARLWGFNSIDPTDDTPKQDEGGGQ